MFRVTGIAAKMQSGGAPMPVFIGSIVIVMAVLAILLFFKQKLEKKIRKEHAL